MARLLKAEEKDIFLSVWKKDRGLSGNALKLIACVLMFFDHLSQGVALNRLGFSPGTFIYFWQGDRITALATVAVLFGRIAFPIFCFFLVQGIFLTRDVKKQILRLFAFAFVAEIPFDLGLYGEVFHWGHQNVMFTLALGAAAIALCESQKVRTKTQRQYNLLVSLVVLVMGIIAQLLKVDYGFFGIFAIVLFYVAAWSRRYTIFTGLIAFFFEAPLFGTVYLSLVLIHLYNGKRGRGNRYAFYIFYPAHLLLLYGLSLLL